MMVMPFIAIYLTDQLGWSKSHAGIVISCYGIGSMVGSLIGGALIDRIGSYRAMLHSLWVGGVMFMSLVFFKEFYSLCIMLFLTSLLADIFRPAAFGSLNVYSKPENLTRSNALVRLAINLGISIGPLIGGLIMEYASYDWLYIIDGVTCILASLYLYFFLENKESKTPKKRSELVGKLAIQDTKYLIFLFLSMISLVVFFQIINVVPIFLKEFHCMEEDQIGLFFTINGLMIVLLEMPIIHYLEERKQVYTPLIIGVLIIGLGHLPLLMYTVPVFLVIVLYNLIISIGEILNFPFINTYTLIRAKGNQLGSYVGLMTMLFSLAYIIAPLIGFPIVEYLELHYSMEKTYTLFWTGCVAVSVATFLLFLFGRNYLDVGHYE